MADKVIELARNGDVVVYKKYGITQTEFERDHACPGIPVVLGDATKDWPALANFTPEYFKSNFGDVKLSIKNTEAGIEGDDLTVRECLEMLENSTVEKPGPYPCNFPMDKYFAEAVPQVEPPITVSRPDRLGSRLVPNTLLGGAHNLEIFFGGPGGQFPYMHYDYMGMHAFINEIYGRKEFTVIPPWQAEYVYPADDNPWQSSVANHHAPDLEKFPLFAKASKVTFSIGPGETLFIPNGWWHTARSLETTISVAFDRLDRSNWKRFRNEVQWRFSDQPAVRRKVTDAYLVAVGGLLTASESAGRR